MTYDLSKIIGATLYLKNKAVVCWFYPNSDNTEIYEAGELAGVVYSWIETEGEIWLMFKNQSGDSYYIKFYEGLFETQNLRGQGVLSNEELAETNDNWFMKIIKFIVPIVVFIIFILFVVKKIFEKL